MESLPTIPFGPVRITRLIIGGNPLRGNSHQSGELDREMEGYFTAERVRQTLFDCERQGINTIQARGDVLVQSWIREFRAEGGKMHFIAQTASELRDLRGHVQHLARFGAAGVYVHGTFTDRHYHEDDMREVETLLKIIRDTGVQVGLGTHTPEVIDLAEERDWDIDFYMTCMYNLSRKRRGSALVSGRASHGDVYDPSDKYAMFERIRATRRTCLAFKVLAAGRLCDSLEEVREAFSAVLANIKPVDAMVVGMFPKRRDQVAENAQIVREILASAVTAPPSSARG